MGTADTLRELYQRFGQGDMAGVLALCADDITFTVPGKSPLAGSYTKETFVPGLITSVMQRSAGTFREDVVDILAGDSHAAAYLTHSFQRDGKPVEYRTIHLWGVRDGKFSSWQEYPDDLHAFDAAWS